MNKRYNNLIKKDEKNFPRGLYKTHPTFEIGSGKIFNGYKALFSKIKDKHKNNCSVFVIDGFNGLDWNQLKDSLTELFSEGKYKVFWEGISNCLLPEKNINSLIDPFLGKNDPLWGTHYPFGMESFLIQ